MAERKRLGLHRERSGAFHLADARQLALAPGEKDRAGALRALATGLNRRSAYLCNADGPFLSLKLLRLIAHEEHFSDDFFPTPPNQAHTGCASLDVLASAKPAPLHHFRLDNGLSVYLHENHSAPLAAVQLWYHIGASHEPPGHSNLSHLLEHLVFQGSSKLPAGQYSRLIARLGGVANATTHDDATSFEMILPASRLPVALELMADAMKNATLDPAAFEQEVKAVADERRFRVDNSPIQLAFEQHRMLAHGDNAYAMPSFGYSIDPKR